MGVVDEEVAPTFTKKPQLRQEDDGNKLVFECQLVSNPKASIQWYKGDEALHDDHRTKVIMKEISPNKYNISLEINDVFETDAGLYKVNAKNKQGEVAASINLNFSPADEPHDYQIDGIAPTFAKKPTIRQEDEGRRLLFECRILADPKPVVSWYHDNSLIQPSGRCKLILDKDGNAYFSTLEINDVTIEDGGKYKVIAKNELGESNATISLNFDSDESDMPSEGARPIFTEKPIIKGADNFTKVTFECRLLADPKPTIEWFHNGKKVSDGGRYKYGLISDKHNHVVSLEISKVAAADAGEYKAVAKNKHGDGQANINLNFEDNKPQIPTGKTPRFPKKPTIRQEGESLVLECILEADPFPQIVWFHGTKQIKDGKRHKIQKKDLGSDTYLLSLEIKEPAAEDGGNYRCNAVNELGESNANIALNFQGTDKAEGLAPEFLEKPQIIPKEGGKLIILQCKVKAKPAPKITWYQGAKQVKESNRVVVKVLEVIGDEFTVSLEIRDPSKDDGGAYKCHMINEHGELNANLNLNIEAETPPPSTGEAPTFVEKPKIIPEDGGNRIIMTCKVRATPKPEIKWYCDGARVEESSRIKQTIKEDGDVYSITLELRSLEVTDAGLYKCNVRNKLGDANANLTLNIELAPAIKEKPKIIKKEIHKVVIIECTVLSVSKPNCSWMKESTVIKEDGRRTVKVTEVSKGEYAVALEIDKPTGSDGGSYKMVAKNEKGEITSTTVQVDIEEEKVEKKEEKKEEAKPSGDQPKIVQELTSLVVQTGKTAEFFCKIESKARCTVLWYKDGELVKESRYVENIFDGSSARLLIYKLSHANEGSYKVEAKNMHGTASSSATLTVSDEPVVEKKEEKKEEEKKEEKVVETKTEEKKEEAKPTGDQPRFVQELTSLTVQQGQTAEFLCKIESKARCTVIWYKDGEMVRESRYIEGIFDGSTARLLIYKLSSANEGTYKIEAKNLHGTSFSTATLTVTEGPVEVKKVEEKKVEEKKVEEKQEIKVEKKEEVKIEKKETKIEKKEEVKIEKKEETKIQKKEEVKIEKKEEKKVEKKEEKKVTKDEKKASLKDEGKPSVPQISIEDAKEPGKKAPQAPVIKEPSPEPGSRKASTADVSGQLGRRRGSYVDVLSPGSSRRGSIIIADEKGMIVDESGQTKKLRPGEVLEVGGKRRKSIDVRRASVSEIEDMIDKPCTPLKNIPDGPKKTPPSIIDFQSNYSAIEGATAYISFQVEGNPAPQFHFYKGVSEIFESGRYKIFTDGNSNTVALCIRKSKAQDEGKYKIVAYNEVGEDTTEVSLFVSDESGMDFRSMLKKRQYAKWKEDDKDPDWNLKAPEKERRPSLRETKKKDEFVKPLVDTRAKEGKDLKIRLEAVFSKMNVKAKWYRGKEELFLGKKYHMQSEGDLHTLVINKPVVDDSGRYKIECMGISSACIVEVDEPDPVYVFTKKLPENSNAYTTKEAILECAVNDYKAIVTWYKDGNKITATDKYIIEADPLGRKILKITDLTTADCGQYMCKINAEEFTQTKLNVTDQLFKFTRPLKSIRVTENQEISIECELDDWEGKVTWFKGDKELKPDSVIEQISQIRRRKLLFKGVRLTDEGKYTCKSNADSTICEVIVERK